MRMVTKNYPLLNGCGRLANLPLVRHVVDAIHPDEIEVTLRNGLYINSPACDFVGRALLLFGDLDPKITKIAQSILRPGDTVLDIGAHVGLFSMYASEMVGKNGSVHAFEPQANLVQRFERTIEHNQISNVTLHPFALGDATKIAKMHIPAGNSGAASLIRKKTSGITTPVGVFHASEFLDRQNIATPRMIKIDVEGYESAVIRGLIKFILARMPAAIVFEAQFQQSRNNNAAISILEEVGYRCHPILPSALQLRIGPAGKTENHKGVHDILAVAPGILGNEILSLCNDR